MAVTPGRTGRISATGSSHGVTPPRPTRIVPPGPLPADSLELAQEAAAQLGWRGVILPETQILGRKVHLVVRLRTDVHAERIATGMGPVIDRATVATWTWPELAGSAPGAAVEIVGVLAVARHWRTGLAWAVPFSRYYEAGMVLPSSVAQSHDYVNNCLPRARAYGLSLLTVNDTEEESAAYGLVERDVPGTADRIMLGVDPLSRWINELAYEQLLATAEVAV